MVALPRLTPMSDCLKPEVSSWLTMHKYRKRAKEVASNTIRLCPYNYHQYGTDPLLYWYAQVRQAGEHIALWGSYLGDSPSRFIAQAVTWEMVWLMEEGQAGLAEGQDAVGVVWGDDGQAPNRQRIHFWMARPHRHPRVTAALAPLVLQDFFSRYAVLWGITPADNRPALRAIKLWGFQPVGRFPRSESSAGAMVDGIVSVLTRQQWTEHAGRGLQDRAQ